MTHLILPYAPESHLTSVLHLHGPCSCLLHEWAPWASICVPALRSLRCRGIKDRLLVLQVLRQRQEGEAVALRSVQKLQEERRLLQERLGSLQRALAQLEAEKRELERSALQLDKDRVALRKTLDKVPALHIPRFPCLLTELHYPTEPLYIPT